MKLGYTFSLTPTPNEPAPSGAGVLRTPMDYWSFPPFGMLAFPDFARVGTESPAAFRHPAGHLALITVLVVSDQLTQEQRVHVAADRKLSHF
jgi:hypothetical protein